MVPQHKSSRFPALNVFKLKPDAAPPPPPKDSALSPPTPAFYNRSLFSRSATSLAPSLSPESISGPATPSTPYPPIGLEFGKRAVTLNARATASSPAPSAYAGSLKSFGRGGGDYLASPSMDGSTDSSGSWPNTNYSAKPMYLLNGASSSTYTIGQATTVSVKSKKSVFKLVNLAKRNKSKKDLSDSASMSGSVSRSTSVGEQEDAPINVEGDDGISMPWNFQHNIHVDEGYIGLPPSWTSALSQVGFTDDEITTIHARRRAAATGSVPNTPPPNTPSPNLPLHPLITLPTSSASSSTIILDPAPRSTSLGKGRDALTITPSSMYSVATSIGGSTLGRVSPAPSPKAPSFSMKSFVSNIKHSLTSDSASMKDAVNGSGAGAGASGEESEQYVFVNGDDPHEGGDRGMGDETVIEPYPFDTASVSSYQTHASGTQQGQSTPRTSNFPQIQVHHTRSDSGLLSLHSPVPSPLAHSSTLPIPSPQHRHIHSNHSTSSTSPSLASAGSRAGSDSASQRTPPSRVYHIANLDIYDGVDFIEPPPAYVSPKKEGWIPRKEKEGLEPSGTPLPNKPIPLTPMQGMVGEPSGLSDRDDQDVTMSDTTNRIPGTADEVLDISSYYSDNAVNGGDDAEMDPVQVLSPTPPLVIDKRTLNLATLPPRISLHQDSLDDWSESLFTVIGSKGKRSSILADTASVKKERTIRPMPPPSGADTLATASNSFSPETEAVAPSPSDMPFEASGPHARGKMVIVEEDDEQQQAEENVHEEERAVDDILTAAEEVREVDGSPAAPSTSFLPDISLDPNESSTLDKDLDPPAFVPSSPPESSRRVSADSIPPSPPPKPKPKPAPLVMLPTTTLTPPKTNVITGISGKSPVNSLFGVKPQPLPIPIPPSQIRAQLRPAPPKPSYPPPTLPLPPLKRLTSQLNLPPSPFTQPQLSPFPSHQKTFKHDYTISHASPSDSRPSSSQTLLPDRTNSDRDSGLSTITVTPATIATAKAELVRTAVASVVDSDTVSLTSQRQSIVSTADTERDASTSDEPDMGAESPVQEVERSSVSLLRDGPQSKWPTPPPPPVELEADSTPRRVSRFRTTSLGRVTQLQAIGGSMTSPTTSNSSHGSSSGSTSESTPLPTPKGVNGVSPSTAPKMQGGLPAEARLLTSATDTFGGVAAGDESEESESSSDTSDAPLVDLPSPKPPSAHPLLVQLQPYISPRTPSSYFTNLVEIAEGESGSVFAARVAPSLAVALSHDGQGDNMERPIASGTSHVAIKRIPLPPVASSPRLTDDAPISNKVVSVLHELTVLRDLDHEHLLLLDAIYVCSDSTNVGFAGMPDTSLWIRMELMERSLADVIGLVAEGLALQERLIARFASDILHGLDYLQRQHIAHRDVRSDNLLVNAAGVVKLADFSNAIRVDRNAPNVSGAVGVIYWQAPEMRAGSYNALKVDSWSLGATVWELAETVPPFSAPASPSTQVSFDIQATWHVGSQWPPLTHPEHYSRQFHEFLKLCGRESAGRPSPGELLNTSFIRNACGRPVIFQLLSQCRAIEETIAAREAS